MKKKWINFVIFHHELFDENYTCDPSFDHRCYQFVKCNETFRPVYNSEFGYDVMYEHDFEFYDKTLQARSYYAPSVIYHVYKNRIHERFDYVGFMEYDLSLQCAKAGGPLRITETIDHIINENDAIIVTYRNFHTFGHLAGQEDMPLAGDNWSRTMIRDYNEYFNTHFDPDTFKDCPEKAATQQSFLADRHTFEHLMGFITHVIEDRLAERGDGRTRPCTFLERYFSIALQFEQVKKLQLNLHHTGLGHETGYQYGSGWTAKTVKRICTLVQKSLHPLFQTIR
ncbi:MAG: hypothetical protein JW860_03015 [Sedimentisphaerales bacterium]|nr:hypothetical protein [Sedimentisphaerales bacterium]